MLAGGCSLGNGPAFGGLSAGGAGGDEEGGSSGTDGGYDSSTGSHADEGSTGGADEPDPEPDTDTDGDEPDDTTGTTGEEDDGPLVECPPMVSTSTSGTIVDVSLPEVSGLAASRTAPGLLWAHNDSGDSARVYVLGLDGALLNTLGLPNVGHVDFEDIAVGPGPTPGRSYVYVGDIGDNDASRPFVTIHRFEENGDPAGYTGISSLETFDLYYPYHYPSSSHDAETLFVDPVDAAVYVVAEVAGRARLFRAPNPLWSGGELEDLGFLNTVDFIPTAGDISPQGDFIVMRGPSEGGLWLRAPGQTVLNALQHLPCELPIEAEGDGESITVLADERSYVTTSEGIGQPIWHYEF
ncbi:MAG: hypothetical protein AB1Z98_25115 [Nannocystaceae bacterium]